MTLRLVNVRARTTPPPAILITLLSSYFLTLGPLEGLTLSTFRGVFLIQFYPLEITQREIIFEIEACERQGKDYYVKTLPTILVIPIFLPSFPH